MGLLTYAYPAARSDLERATERFREFREQPTPELARSVGIGLEGGGLAERAAAAALPPVDELPDRAAVRARERGHRDRRRLPLTGLHARRSRSGSCSATSIGKPVGILGSSWLLTRLSRGRLRPPVGWAAVAGGGTIAGIGFTVALLVATLAFDGRELEEAKLGILAPPSARRSSPGCSSAPPRCSRAACGSGRCSARAEPLVDLYIDVDPERDHIRGPDRRAGDGGRVRRLRVPVLRAGGTGRARAAARLRRRPLRLAAPAAQRRPSATPSSPPRPPRPRPTRAPSGRCTTSCSPTRTRSARTT